LEHELGMNFDLTHGLGSFRIAAAATALLGLFLIFAISPRRLPAPQR
jgi:hypothetical protein